MIKLSGFERKYVYEKDKNQATKRRRSVGGLYDTADGGCDACIGGGCLQRGRGTSGNGIPGRGGHHTGFPEREGDPRR